MNPTKQWMLMERINTTGEYVTEQGFAEAYTIIYKLDKRYYTMDYWDGELMSIARVKDKKDILRYEKQKQKA